ncbi:MAG: hypothetical protein PHX78_11610 [bacterium]|nr:hypothetical protein [bacterium]
MKKQLIIFYLNIFILLIFLSSYIYASWPIPNETITTSNSLFTVEIQTCVEKKEKAIIIKDRNKSDLFSFKLEELPSIDIKNLPYVLDGGNYWYENAIMFFNKDENIVIIRLKDGNLILINLYTGKILKEISEAEKLFIEKRIIELAQMLIKSQKPSDKEAGAIICGQLKLKETIPDLKKLLSGNTNSIRVHLENDKAFIIFTIRQAAKQALESMGEKVDAVIMEEDTTYRPNTEYNK